MTLLGNAQRTSLTITMCDSAQKWHVSRLSSAQVDAETTFTGTLRDTEKIIISVEPPSGGLVRMGGDYQITLSGTVSYGSERANGDPVFGTYLSYYGACKFLANGAIECTDGTTATWKPFDAGSHIYAIDIAGLHYSERWSRAAASSTPAIQRSSARPCADGASSATAASTGAVIDMEPKKSPAARAAPHSIHLGIR
ncbi:MAG: hypothetical protein ACYC8W_04565 [Candidatus Tyrphobacter sp.]